MITYRAAGYGSLCRMQIYCVYILDDTCIYYIGDDVTPIELLHFWLALDSTSRG